AVRTSTWPSTSALGVSVTIIQTSDPVNYAPLLACGRVANENYAIKKGFSYSTFVGLKRGYFPWHACFNRIFLLKELAAAGYAGWAFYLDADAYIYDQCFDLNAYLEAHRDKCLIAGPGGLTDLPWDINDGVLLVNFGHKDALEIVDRWHQHFMDTEEE